MGVLLHTVNARLPESAGPPGSPPAPPARLSSGLREAAACVLGLVLLCGPVAGGLTHSLALTAVTGLLLWVACLLWLGSEALGGRLRVRLGWPGALYAAFVAFAVLSSLLAANRFAGLRWCLLIVTYGLAGFLVLQLAGQAVWRRFLLACLAATGAALAAYAIWHYAFYVPALRRWLAQEPDFVQAATEAAGALAGDLAARVHAEGAYGSFITSNQMACFLAVCFFPLAGLGAALLGPPPGRRAAATWAARGVLAAALLLTVGALWLSRSKGGAIAFGFGLAVFAAGAAWGLVRRRTARAAALAVLVALVIGALGMWLAREPSRLRRSLGVRTGYWRTSLQMARHRPLSGVGPDSWPEWYTMLKRPEDEDSRAAHSVYVQLLAETGAVGLLLWCAFWAVLLARCMGRPGSEAAAPPEAGEPCERSARRAAFTGPAMAALALAFDRAFVGTFTPPQHVPHWLAAAPWLPYAVAWCVWAAVFAATFSAAPRAWPRLTWVGVGAGLGVFLVHSAGDFTLRVPAVGIAMAALGGLWLSANPPPAREPAPGRWAAAAVLVGVAVLAAAWSCVLTPRALTAALSLQTAEDLRLGLVGGRTGPGELPARAGRVAREYGRACRAVPWDDRAWREGAAALLWFARAGADGPGIVAAARAARKAVALSPLNASNWSLLAEARRAAGDGQGALAALRRAAELQPSLPAAWYACGRAAEACGEAEAAAAAYRRALELMPRQYHARNKPPARPAELARFWATLTRTPPATSLVELARGIAARAGGVQFEPDLDEAAVAARLAEGREGARQLMRDWPGLGPRARERRLWQVVGPRLWEWALGQKLLDGVRPVPPGDPGGDGASGGT